MADTSQTEPRRWRAPAVCLIGGFMTLLDVSIVNVALPSVHAGLGASATSAAAGPATSPTWMVATRLLQGVAGGLLNPQIAGFVQQLSTAASAARHAACSEPSRHLHRGRATCLYVMPEAVAGSSRRRWA